MFAVIAVIAFAIAFILDLAGISRGHADVTTFEIAGWLFTAAHLAWAVWHGRPGGPGA
jgi:hypothetical protein